VRRTVQRDSIPVRSNPGLLRPLALAMIAVACWAALGATASAAVATVGSVLQAAKAAIATQAGVHVQFVARSSSTSKTEKILADIGRTSGAETISVGSAHLAVKVTPSRGYASGNTAGLTTLFGLSAAEAKKAGADWVSWKVGTSQYSDLKADVTMTSVTALIPKADGTKLSSAVTNGARLFVLTWTIPGTSSTPQVSNRLTISASGMALPVEATSTASDGTTATTTLSRWGEPVQVGAPPIASTIASSKVTG
jgi:hypothetical protein